MKKILSSFIRKRNDKYYVYVEYIDEVGKKKQKSQGSFINKKDADNMHIRLNVNFRKPFADFNCLIYVTEK